MVIEKLHLSWQPKPDDEAYADGQSIAGGIGQILANDRRITAGIIKSESAIDQKIPGHRQPDRKKTR